MALKSTIHKATLQISDMDHHVYGEHQLTVAQHPSETAERMMMRVLAYALWRPADDLNGRLELAKGLSDTDEPDLWRLDLTGEVQHWIELGQPDDRRLMKASSRANRVTVLSYTASTPIWWAGLSNKLTRAPKVEVWQIEPEQSLALAATCQRSMQWQVTIQDGTVWISTDKGDVEITPQCLKERG